MLDISKIEAGHMVRENTEVNLKQLIHGITSLVSFRAVEKGLNFGVTMASDLPEDVTLDSGKLRQVITKFAR